VSTTQLNFQMIWKW